MFTVRSIVGYNVTMVTRCHSASKRTCSIVVMTTDDSSQSAMFICHDVTLDDEADNSPVADNKDNTNQSIN